MSKRGRPDLPPLDDVVDGFFEAQDLVDGGHEAAAQEALEGLIEHCSAAEPYTAPPLSRNSATSDPPLAVVVSSALNLLGELHLDAAMRSGYPQTTQSHPRVDEAVFAFNEALRYWPHANASAALSLGTIYRDCGRPGEALAVLLEIVSQGRMPQAVEEEEEEEEEEEGVEEGKSAEGAGGDGQCWYSGWATPALERCLPIATMQASLIMAQMGRHDEALPLISRFFPPEEKTGKGGFRVSPAVWQAAALMPKLREIESTVAAAEWAQQIQGEAKKLQAASKGGGAGGASAATVAAASAAARRSAATVGPSSSSPVRFFANAVPEHLLSVLTTALAPSSPYWAETGYGQREYFSFFVDLRQPSGSSSCTSAVETLIRDHLLPLTGMQDRLVGAEWWVHTRLAEGRSLGHQLHYDMEEGILEAKGEVLHPAVSSVVYLTGATAGSGAGPTVVFDEVMEQEEGEGEEEEGEEEKGEEGQKKPAKAKAKSGDKAVSRKVCPPISPMSRKDCWLSLPRDGAFMTFPGDRLHGVLPGTTTVLREEGQLEAEADCGGGGTAARGAAAAGARGGKAKKAKKAKAGEEGGERASGGSGKCVKGSSSSQEHRLTLMVAWWDVPTQEVVKRRSKYGPQSTAPRCTRGVTWPGLMQVPPPPTEKKKGGGAVRENGTVSGGVQHPGRAGGDDAGGAAAGLWQMDKEKDNKEKDNKEKDDKEKDNLVRPAQENIRKVCPAWEVVPPCGLAESAVPLPHHIDPRFYLRSTADIKQRLMKEHADEDVEH